MGSFKFYATLAGVLAIATTARAADLLPPPPPPPMPVDVGGGWYLRGDVGVSNYQGGKLKGPAAAGVDTTYFGEDYGSGAFAGVGVGYQFTNWFRADVTGEYRFSTGFKGYDKSTFAGGYSNEINQGSYYGGVGLVNGYFDLGTWYGLTPFVGGGVGFAYNKLSGFDDTAYNTVYNGTPFPPTYPSGGSIKDKDKVNFAWALHAGVAYDINPNLKLELAYRYLNLGDMKTGLVNCYCGQTYAGLTAKDIESHDVKLGMRWLLGGPVYAAPPPSESYAPIVRKY